MRTVQVAVSPEHDMLIRLRPTRSFARYPLNAIWPARRALTAHNFTLWGVDMPIEVTAGIE